MKNRLRSAKRSGKRADREVDAAGTQDPSTSGRTEFTHRRICSKWPDRGREAIFYSGKCTSKPFDAKAEEIAIRCLDPAEEPDQPLEYTLGIEEDELASPAPVTDE